MDLFYSQNCSKILFCHWSQQSSGAVRVNNLNGVKMKKAKLKLRDIIKNARRLTCADSLNNRGLGVLIKML